MPLLSVSDLYVNYRSYWYIYKVLNGVNITINKGEKVGVIGESGSGKTTLLKSIIKILPPQGRITRGSIIYKNIDVTRINENDMSKIRRSEIGMIFQDPTAALNPVFTIGEQLFDILKYSLEYEGKQVDKREIMEIAEKLLADVTLPDPQRILRSYPFQLSGGMRQRVVIAMALASARELLLADEPTTNLDVTIQDQILKLIDKLVRERSLTLILVSHALGMVKKMTDKVYVVYAGDVVEEGSIGKVFKEPLHPYTQLLFKNVPRLSGGGIGEGIIGKLLDYRNPPPGCRFHTRCPFAMDICKKEKPAMINISRDRGVACHLYREEVKQHDGNK
ncbi:MAG TPA: ABC transporter ATP-binding protein [Sulfolobales archaeon]|nr:ABC transporter ATP-binding protein [Sulfolobales archaeon]